MVIKNFNFAKTPALYFGAGKINELPKIISGFGKNILLVTGKSSFKQSPYRELIYQLLNDAKISFTEIAVSGEPSPYLINKAVETYRNANIEAVVSIGGGSVVDAGKAISAMLCEDKIIETFLEGIGTANPTGNKKPFIAIPTTAGTGSEATKNSVISNIDSKNGFKKSLRHDNYVPDVALIDPQLQLTVPSEITASCGLDALTQLLEAYTSPSASPLTDSLCESGLAAAGLGLSRAYNNGSSDLEARSLMSYAAYMSGMALANAGLGIVHGIASVLGGYYNIPHGVACGTILASATRINIDELKKDQSEQSKILLKKYIKAGKIFNNNQSDETSIDSLLMSIANLLEEFKIPRLSNYGINSDDLSRLANESENKNNPIKLSKTNIELILKERL